MESSAQWRPVTRGDSVLPCPPGGSQFQMAQLVGAEEHVARLAEPHILGVPMGCTPGPSCRPRGNGDQNQECPAQPSLRSFICPSPHNGVGVPSPGFAEARGPER